MRGLLDDLATRWSRERAAHSRCRGPIGAKTDGRVKIIKLLSGFDTLDWTPPLLWLWQRRHDGEMISSVQRDGLGDHPHIAIKMIEPGVNTVQALAQ